MFNHEKLRGRIVEKYGSQRTFCGFFGKNEITLSRKINGEVDWKQSEIMKAIRLLGLSAKDIPEYFFNEIKKGTEK
jgi:hypothetical protein|nr:MAG TPA: Protein of unknown function (DUF739) [Caudoviricetes sp.]